MKKQIYKQIEGKGLCCEGVVLLSSIDKRKDNSFRALSFNNRSNQDQVISHCRKKSGNLAIK